MNWKKERDLLISQTMAFVESVTGKTPDFEQTLAKSDIAKSDIARSDIARPRVQAAPMVQAAPDEATKTDTPEIVEPPEDVRVDVQIPRAAFSSDVRTEMQARVANFRAHQERFSREREEYFSSTLTKARAGIRSETTPDPSDRTPPNR